MVSIVYARGGSLVKSETRSQVPWVRPLAGAFIFPTTLASGQARSLRDTVELDQRCHGLLTACALVVSNRKGMVFHMSVRGRLPGTKGRN